MTELNGTYLLSHGAREPSLNTSCSASEGGAAAQEGSKKASARSVTLNLITGGLGLGIFSLPWSTAGASLIPGLLIIVAIVALNGFTVEILIQGAEKYQVFDLGALLSHLPGPLSRPAQVATNASVWTVLFISQLGYIDVMSNAMMEISRGTILHHRPSTVVLSSVIVLPLCFLDQRKLNFTSIFAIVVNVYIFALMLIEPKNPSGMCIVGAGMGSVAMIAVMMQAVVIQMCVLPMYQELEDRSPAKFRRVVATGFSSLIIIFGAFAAVGYATFGPSVRGNILDSLPDNIWGKIGRVGAGICVACVYPIFLQSMVAPFWNLRESPYRKSVAAAATTLTVALVAIVAFFVESVSAVNVYSGAVCSVAFVAGVPGVVGLFLLDRHSLFWRIGMCILLAFGIICGVLGMAYTDNYSLQLSEHCSWVLA